MSETQNSELPFLSVDVRHTWTSFQVRLKHRCGSTNKCYQNSIWGKFKKIVTSKITSFFGFPLVLAIIDAISSSILNVNVINQLKEAICVGSEEETGEVVRDRDLPILYKIIALKFEALTSVTWSRPCFGGFCLMSL